MAKTLLRIRPCWTQSGVIDLCARCYSIGFLENAKSQNTTSSGMRGKCGRFVRHKQFHDEETRRSKVMSEIFFHSHEAFDGDSIRAFSGARCEEDNFFWDLPGGRRPPSKGVMPL